MRQLINIMRAEFEGVEKTAKVYHDTEEQIYVVQFYIGKTHLAESDYVTDEKDDAVGTGSAFTAKPRVREEASPACALPAPDLRPCWPA